MIPSPQNSGMATMPHTRAAMASGSFRGACAYGLP